MKIACCFVFALLLAGCGVTVTPRATATAKVDLAENSISESKNGLTVKARLQDLEFAPALVDSNLTAFALTVGNQSRETLTMPLDAFLLVDDQGNQYRPVPPEQVQEIMRQNAPYLLPYPYVGYYYLEDIEKAGAARTFDSSLPYFAQTHPGEALARALPAAAILPGNQVSGLVFFLIDLSREQSIELRGYLPGSAMDRPADFVLPFSVEKK